MFESDLLSHPIIHKADNPKYLCIMKKLSTIQKENLVEDWEHSHGNHTSQSAFGSFYRKLLNVVPKLTEEPLELLASLGSPTFRCVEHIPFSMWAQIVHALSPCHLSQYHKQTAFGFKTGKVLDSKGYFETATGSQAGSVHFEMARLHLFPGTNTHNYYGPFLFGVGEFHKPHLVFGIIPDGSDAHFLEVSVYSKNTSRSMQLYYMFVHGFFMAIARKSIEEDRLLYQRYSKKTEAERFLHGSSKSKFLSPTECMRSMYSQSFASLMTEIEGAVL